MKRLISAVVVASLFSIGWIWLSSSASSRSVQPLFQAVLQAHGGQEALGSTVAFQAQAVRLTSTQPSAFFERQLRVSVNGTKFRRHIIHPLGLSEQEELFDGQAGFHTTSSRAEPGNGDSLMRPMDNGRLRAVKFSIETFGLLPLLRQCADSATEAIFAGRAPGSLNKFQVRTPTGEWRVYADSSHLIRKLEIEDKTFAFADYRTVNGLRLPYIERVSVGDRLIYELVFSAIDLNPSFSADHFKSETLGRDTAR